MNIKNEILIEGYVEYISANKICLKIQLNHTEKIYLNFRVL